MLTKPPFAASRALRFYDRRQSPRTTDELALTQALNQKETGKQSVIGSAWLICQKADGRNEGEHAQLAKDGGDGSSL